MDNNVPQEIFDAIDAENWDCVSDAVRNMDADDASFVFMCVAKKGSEEGINSIIGYYPLDASMMFSAALGIAVLEQHFHLVPILVEYSYAHEVKECLSEHKGIDEGVMKKLFDGVDILFNKASEAATEYLLSNVECDEETTIEFAKCIATRDSEKLGNLLSGQSSEFIEDVFEPVICSERRALFDLLFVAVREYADIEDLNYSNLLFVSALASNPYAVHAFIELGDVEKAKAVAKSKCNEEEYQQICMTLDWVSVAIKSRSSNPVDQLASHVIQMVRNEGLFKDVDVSDDDLLSIYRALRSDDLDVLNEVFSRIDIDPIHHLYINSLDSNKPQYVNLIIRASTLIESFPQKIHGHALMIAVLQNQKELIQLIKPHASLDWVQDKLRATGLTPADVNEHMAKVFAN